MHVWLVVTIALRASVANGLGIPLRARVKSWLSRQRGEEMKTLWFEERVAVVVLGRDRVDTEAVRRVAKARRLAAPAVAAAETGYAMGSLPPCPLSAARVTIVDEGVASSRERLRCSGVATFANGSEVVRRCGEENGGVTVRASVALAKVAIEASGAPTQFACRVTSKRSMARVLCFLSVAPLAGEWAPTQGAARQVQVICGKTLEARLGSDKLARLLKSLKVGDRLLVSAVAQRSRRPDQLDFRCTALEILPPAQGAEEAPKKKKYVDLPEEVLIRVVESADEWRQTARRLSPVVGLDAEWEPGESSAAIVQLATPQEVFVLDLASDVFDLGRLDTVVGFGVENDLVKIRNAGSRIDVGTVVELKREPRDSLAGLVRNTLGADLDKTLQRSPWRSQRPLAADVLRYAALDAHVLLSLYERQALPVGDLQVSSGSLAVGDAAKGGKDAAILALLGRPPPLKLDYNRRAGFIRLKDAALCFVSWPSNPNTPRKYPNVLRPADDGRLELTWWPSPSERRLSSSAEHPWPADLPVFLFARVASRPYFFCGRLETPPRPIPGDPAQGVVFALADSAALLQRRRDDPALASFLDLLLPAEGRRGRQDTALLEPREGEIELSTKVTSLEPEAEGGRSSLSTTSPAVCCNTQRDDTAAGVTIRCKCTQEWMMPARQGSTLRCGSSKRFVAPCGSTRWRC